MGVLTSKWFWLAVFFASWTAGVTYFAEDYGSTRVELDCTEAEMDAMIDTAAANNKAFKQMRQRYDDSLAEARQAAEYQRLKNEKLRGYRDEILTDTVTADIPADWMRKVSDAFHPGRMLAEPGADGPGGTPADP